MKITIMFLIVIFCFVCAFGYAEDDKLSQYAGLIRDLKIISEEEDYWTDTGEYVQKNEIVEIEMLFVTIKGERSRFIFSPGFNKNECTIYDGPGGVTLFKEVLRLFHLKKEIILIIGIEKSDFEVQISKVVFPFIEFKKLGLIYELSLENSDEDLSEPEQLQLDDLHMGESENL